MRAWSLVRRPALTTGVVFLLFAPLLMGPHHHEVDHDGAKQHLEAPHGGHEAAVAETSDHVPSTGLELSLEAGPGSAVKLEAGITVRAAGVISDDPHHPARAPPRSHRSRAPPLLS